MRLRRFATFALAGILAAPAQAAPRIEHWQSAGGTPVFFIAAPQIPMLDIEVTLDAGNSRDGAQPGLSQLTLSLLDMGAGDLDADAIAQAFEDVGAAYGSAAHLDRATLSLRTLTDPSWMAPALNAFLTVLGQPRFPPEQLDLRRQQMQVALQKIDEDPGAIALRAFYAALYPDHPYGSPAGGTAESIAAITRDDVVQFHRKHFTAGGAVIAMVGAIDRAAAEDIANRISEALPDGTAPAPLPKPQAPAAAETVTIPHPSEQAHILIGQQGVARGEAHHFPLYLGNFTLGGSGFSSRLVEEIRTKQGLAYSVYSYFFPMRLRGPYRLGLQTRGDQTGQALETAYAELRRFVRDGPTEEELEYSRNSLTRGFPLRIADNASMLNYLSMIGYYRLPLDYLDTWTDRIEAITHEQIVAAYRKTLNPEQLITVVVGGQNRP